MKNKPLTLSVRVPICKGRCGYCDASVCTGKTSEEKQDYIHAVYRELAATVPEMEGYQITDIHITGGCPNLLGGAVIEELVRNIRSAFHVSDKVPVSLASSPAGIGVDLLEHLKRAGISRIDLEQETFDPLQHLTLESCFTLGNIEDSFNVLNNAHFPDFGVSLLYGLCGQGVPSIEASVAHCREMHVSRIRFAPLRINEKMPLYESWKKQIEQPSASPRHVFPDETKRRELYQAGCQILEKYGYRRISQYDFASDPSAALPPLVAEHLEIGLGATSCYDEIFYRNTSDFSRYIAHSDNFKEIMAECGILNDRKILRRKLADGLYAIDGIPMKQLFSSRKRIENCLKDLKKNIPETEDWKKEGLLEESEEGLKLTEEGGFRYEEISLVLKNS